MNTECVGKGQDFGTRNILVSFFVNRVKSKKVACIGRNVIMKSWFVLGFFFVFKVYADICL